MKTYKMHQAKTNLSKIVNEVQEGETVYLAKSNKIVAELKPYHSKKKAFPFGLYEGKLNPGEDWDNIKTNKEVSDSFNESI